MHIQLKPKHRATSARPAAAFLEGSDPVAWLLEISRWGLPHERLRCYALPRSLQTVEPAGLLVVFQQAADAKQADPKNPYQALGGKLYVPADAEVFPAVNEAEWPALLTWDVQVLHPHIGLVGFHHSDALDLSTLPQFGPSRPADWGLAQNGISPRPPFRHIEVRQIKTDDLIQSLRKDEGTKPLSDLSPKKPSETPAALDGLRRYLLTRALAATGRYRDNFGNPNRPNDGNDWLASVEQWVQRQLDAIVNKRRSEIERLLDLFNRDTDEALRYALPLEDPYAKRGTAPPSTALGPRSTDFSLGNIGGGSASDNWTLEDKHLRDLRLKYHAAARKAIADGDFRRAAYIYAHLLHDYNTAASALRQGGYWREAAALYKDHLGNLPAAAECLEMGQLYWEAIEIYEKLARHEKCGDLYLLTGEAEKAAAAWEKHIEAALRNDDYMDATRVLLEKTRDPERAKNLLLEAWTKPSKQAEPCLRRYFHTVAETEREQLPLRVQEVAQQHTVQPQQRGQLLQALLHLAEQRPGADVMDISRHIAYGIVSELAERGDKHKLFLLQKFLPDDRLLAGDASRFSDKKRSPKILPDKALLIQLDKTVQWVQAIVHRNQILAFGAKNNQLHLARANWHGQVEHHVWSMAQPVQWPLTVYDFPYTNNYVFLHDADGAGISEKILPASVHFDSELVAGWPTWLPEAPMALRVDTLQEKVMVASETSSVVCLYLYTYGKFAESTPLLGDPEEPHQQGLSDMGGARLPMLKLGGSTFIANREFLLKIKTNLQTEIIPVGERSILKMLATQGPNSLRLVLVTEDGCAVVDPFQEKTELRDVDFFAQNDGDCEDAQLIGENHLVVAWQEAVEVYELNRMSCSGRIIFRVSFTDEQVVAVLPTARRDRFAVLNRQGKLREFGLRGE